MLKIKKLIGENKGFLLLMFGIFCFRSAVASLYFVPTGSMYPTLMIGDQITANKLAYDVKIPFTDVILKHLADPQRGDIVTFNSPEDGTLLVKRLVGLPGDVVEMRNEHLLINGVAAAYDKAPAPIASQISPDYDGTQWVLREQILGNLRPIIVTPDRSALRTFGPVTVPQGQYMMLGDNRDNSKDSRYIGTVKRELLVGQVKYVTLSVDTAKYFMPRLARFGAALN